MKERYYAIASTLVKIKRVTEPDKPMWQKHPLLKYTYNKGTPVCIPRNDLIIECIMLLENIIKREAYRRKQKRGRRRRRRRRRRGSHLNRERNGW